jgi:RHS repeat-associated protein
LTGGGGGCGATDAGAGGGGGGGYFGGGAGNGGADQFVGLGGSASAGGGGGGGSSFAESAATHIVTAMGQNAGNGGITITTGTDIPDVPYGGAYTAANGFGGGDLTACGCLNNGHHKDPVSMSDGDFYDTATDVTVPGPGVALSFVRTYDAMSAQAGNSGPLGPGWSDNLNMTVSLDPTSNVATVTEANGSQVLFNPYSSANAWCNSSYNYCPQSPRDTATLEQNTSTGAWTFTDDAGPTTTYAFTSSGVLSQVTNSAGNTLSASSETAGTGNCPSGVSSCTLWTSNASTPNPTLTEAFSSGELVKVIGFATTGGTPPSATFCYYGETACSPPTTGGLSGSLYSASDPGSLTTKYTYDATNSATQLRDDLLTRTDPDSGVLTNVYNAAGQISQQTDPSGEVTTYSYSGTPMTGAGGTTTATDYPAGTGAGAPTQVTQYNYAFGELGSTTLDPGGSGASTTTTARSDITGQVDSSQDPNAHTSTLALPTPPTGSAAYLNAIDPTSSTDALGNTTLYAYTSSNEIWCEVGPAEEANAVTCPSTEPTTAPTPGAQNTVDLGATITYYDAAGKPTYVTDPLGNTTETAYTSSELPWCTVSANEFTVTGTSCPSTPPSSPPTGTQTGYTTTLYNAAGNVTSVTNPTGATRTDGYTDSSFPDTPTQVTDPVGDLTSITLDSAGRPTSQTETFGSYSATTLTAYDSAGRAFCTIDALAYAQGHTACPSSEPSSPPTPGSDPWSGATVTIYNDDGQALDQVNALGGVTVSAYNQAGQVYCSITPADYAAGTTCPGTPPTTAPSGTLTGYTTTIYDALGRDASVTNPLGGTTATVYDAAGNVAQTTVESNDTVHAPNVVTQNSYDADNNVTSSTLGAGSSAPQTTLTSYDPDGNAFCSVSANAYVAGTSAYQCPTWQPSWIAAPPSPTSLYSSTPSSAQANKVTTTFFNADDQQVQSTNPDVETSVDALDANGNTYCSADPTNVGAWLTAHSSGSYPYLCPSAAPTTAPAQGSNPGYVTTIFDPDGHTASSTDQVGDTTGYTYDAVGDVLTTTDPGGNVTTDCYYGQNASGSCAHSAPAGGGAANDLYSSTTPATSADPGGEVTTTTYFPGDEAQVTQNPAGTTSDSYDAIGDLTSVVYSGVAAGYATPANLAYTYNSDGTRHTMSDGTGTTTYSYDDAGDLTSEALVASGTLANTTTTSSYFDTGVLASVTYPSYGSYASPQVAYAYDATGAMTSSTDWLGNQVTFAHDADRNQTGQSNAVSTANPAGTSSTSVSYDAADNAATSTSTMAQTCGGAETLTQTFSGTGGSRNADGQVTADGESYSGSCSGQASYQRDYSYDPAGRAVYQGSTPQGASADTFAYDPSGDPTTISSHSSSGTYDTYTQSFDAAGEVTSQTPVSGSGGSSSTYSYDSAGDQTSVASGSAGMTSSFDAAGHMTTATEPNGSATYLYNGNGLEAAATDAATWSVSSVDGTNALTSVSCPSSIFCAAVDRSGNAVLYNGSTWSVSSVDGTNALTSVSCPSSTFCAAVDNAGNAVLYNGSTWSVASVDGTNALTSLSCPSSTFCAAVDGTGNAVLYSGSTWSVSSVDGTNPLTSISCSSSTFCAAVDGSGNAVLDDGSTWSATSVDGTNVLSAVSCTASSFCMAADTSGNAISYDGTTWSSATSIDGTTALNGLSCTSSSNCQAVDSSGNALAFNGAAWSSATSIDGTNALAGLSCASASSCVAVDGDGNAVAYTGSKLSQLTWNTNSALPLVISDGAFDYVYGPSDTPVEQVNLATSSPTYMTYTPSNSSWLTTNQAGDETGFWRYDAFGNLALGTPTSAFGYAGQYTDATTGLSNMRARWYEPQVGSFTTRDPEFATTDTAYTYAGGDPVNGSDPTGLAPGRYLYRNGQDWESAAVLEADAANAERQGFPHGVSTFDRAPSRGAYSVAITSDVQRVFPVEKTGRNPNHYTIVLPKPVTGRAANTFNVLFGRTPPGASGSPQPCTSLASYSSDLADQCIGPYIPFPLPGGGGVTLIGTTTGSQPCPPLESEPAIYQNQQITA